MEREYEEYRLKSTTAANVTHNVMVLQSQTADFQDFTPPVRLIRDRHYDSDSDEDAMDVDEAGKLPRKPEPVQAGRGKRKRTRILWLEDEDEIALREQESAPWLLEDFDGQHTFSGRLEGGQQGNYVFFVNQGNEFRVLPISRWYRFQPKLAFQPMSIEEAEAQMAKGVGTGAAMRFNSSKKGQDDGEEAAPKRKLDRILKPTAPSKPTVTKSNSRDEGEDLDFEDIFDDDDEGFDGEDGPTESDLPRKKKVTTMHGRQVKKLVRNLDGEDDDEDDEEEDEVDPYADEDDLEEIADLIAKPANLSQVNLSQTTIPSQSQKVLHPAPVKIPVGSQSPSLSQSSQQKGGSPPSRTVSPALSASASTLITEADIREILRGQPMTTKDLIVRLKPKLKADPSNKETLRELIKKMAMMKPSVSGDDEKLLELRPEYK